MPIDWWHSALAVPVQRQLIGLAPLRDEQAVHQALGGNNESAGTAGLLSPSFLDVYLPSQPNLLFALLLLLVSTVLSLLLLLGMLLRTRFSRFFSVNAHGGTMEDEKPSLHQHQCQPRFRLLLLCFCIPLWLLLLFGSVLYTTTLVDLVSVQGHGEPIATASEALVLLDEQEQVEEALPLTADSAVGRKARSDAVSGQMLRKFEVLRELGYQFRPLISSALFSGWMSLLFLLLLITLLACLLISFLAIMIGLNQRLHRYKPMDHLSAKSMVGGSSRANRVRRLLVGTGVALLCASPAMFALGTTLLVHSHAHSAVCELEQRMSQESAMAEHIRASFSAEEQATTLPEFMADFAKERTALNEESCARERAPLESLWSSCLLLAMCSASFGLCLMLLSGGWSNTDGEAGSVSLRAYVPGWLQNSALTPDAYTSIPELMNSSGGGTHQSIRHPSSTASQCSFGTGTFVYSKKY